MEKYLMDNNLIKNNKNILIIVLVSVLFLCCMSNMYESFASGTFDITSDITTTMDWKGATLSGMSTYTNNLEKASPQVLKDIRHLQKYEPSQDGRTTSTWVSQEMKITENINNPEGREGFTQMNMYVPSTD